jgi:hypothetical protein
MPNAPSLRAATTEALTARLKGIPKPEVKMIADTIGRLNAGGFKPDDVFPIGIIINDRDGVEIRGHVSADDLAEMVKLIPTINPKAISIFPRGIVVPENYRVHLTLGRN